MPPLLDLDHSQVSPELEPLPLRLQCHHLWLWQRLTALWTALVRFRRRQWALLHHLACVPLAGLPDLSRLQLMAAPRLEHRRLRRGGRWRRAVALRRLLSSDKVENFTFELASGELS